MSKPHKAKTLSGAQARVEELEEAAQAVMDVYHRHGFVTAERPRDSAGVGNTVVMAFAKLEAALNRGG